MSDSQTIAQVRRILRAGDMEPVQTAAERVVTQRSAAIIALEHITASSHGYKPDACSSCYLARVVLEGKILS